jgi:hypothetical protein
MIAKVRLAFTKPQLAFNALFFAKFAISKIGIGMQSVCKTDTQVGTEVGKIFIVTFILGFDKATLTRLLNQVLKKR